MHQWIRYVSTLLRRHHSRKWKQHHNSRTLHETYWHPPMPLIITNIRFFYLFFAFNSHIAFMITKNLHLTTKPNCSPPTITFCPFSSRPSLSWLLLYHFLLPLCHPYAHPTLLRCNILRSPTSHYVHARFSKFSCAHCLVLFLMKPGMPVRNINYSQLLACHSFSSFSFSRFRCSC